MLPHGGCGVRGGPQSAKDPAYGSVWVIRQAPASSVSPT
jgi:hypothetical protein